MFALRQARDRAKSTLRGNWKVGLIAGLSGARVVQAPSSSWRTGAIDAGSYSIGRITDRADAFERLLLLIQRLGNLRGDVVGRIDEQYVLAVHDEIVLIPRVDILQHRVELRRHLAK
jgi:hypothetical protein